MLLGVFDREKAIPHHALAIGGFFSPQKGEVVVGGAETSGELTRFRPLLATFPTCPATTTAKKLNRLARNKI